MQVGLMAPQGWKGEYDGWPPADAWARTVELATQAEALGFESLWVFDHFHTVPEPTDEITFESFSVLAALAMATERVRTRAHGRVHRLPQPGADGQDVVDHRRHQRRPLRARHRRRLEGGRVAGLRLRLPAASASGMAALGDHLEVITAMFEPGRATYEGGYAHVRGAINVPKGLQQPRIPIIVGGNGRETGPPATRSSTPTS